VNKWQMDGKSLKWDSRGGHGQDNRGHSQYSIHPLGRTDEHRRKQRKHRVRSGKQ
jgi:hypothetical protein